MTSEHLLGRRAVSDSAKEPRNHEPRDVTLTRINVFGLFKRGSIAPSLLNREASAAIDTPE